MYLVTYLGHLCNGLTLLIISKMLQLEILNPLTYCMIVMLTSLILLLFPSPGVIAVFSLPLFYRQRQVTPFNSFSSFFTLSLSFSYSQTYFGGIYIVSQEQVDSFIAKIQAKIDNVKDT